MEQGERKLNRRERIREGRRVMEVMAGREAKEQPAATAAASGLINLMVSVDAGLQGWGGGVLQRETGLQTKPVVMFLLILN